MDNPTLLLQRQRMLLEIEYNHEKEEFRKQTETMGVGARCAVATLGFR